MVNECIKININYKGGEQYFSEVKTHYPTCLYR